ncbi:erythromycin resistance leader peptide [Robertmurraya kyonggiensis]|uniref:Uncharacterized protein n=1 Tax=Robertmurraya kyonggiensis TaxID=1037680 RepID=A0A4U1CY30_9BACI|nr:hypothetical protein FA727_20370 [Robertmurraya kyonggiensis]
MTHYMRLRFPALNQ